MEHAELRAAVCEANQALVTLGLVRLTWGNVSAVDRAANVMAIKPSGVPYDRLTPEDIVLVDLAGGHPVNSRWRPSSDTPTHCCLYAAFPGIGAIVHTHSPYATAWAQLGRPLPCYGTTHADHFYGAVPVARPLTNEEIAGNYEWASGVSIVDAFRECAQDPLHMPAVFLPGHAPFTWGADVATALDNTVALEVVAQMALSMEAASDRPAELPTAVRDKHFQRKHGQTAYYGQAENDR